jgi:hypothetical protein
MASTKDSKSLICAEFLIIVTTYVEKPSASTAILHSSFLTISTSSIFNSSAIFHASSLSSIWKTFNSCATSSSASLNFSFSA